MAERDLGPFHMVESVYGCGLSLLRHHHEWPTVTIVLSGEFAEILPDGARWCQRSTIVVKPAGVPHSNWYGSSGAHCLIAELREAPSLNDNDTSGSLPSRVLYSVHGPLNAASSRALRAYRDDDDTARMALESVLHEIMGEARAPVRCASSATALQRAMEYLHAEFMRPLLLRDVAAAAGVQPSYLARAFRRHFARTPGEVLRELRVNWAAHLLIETGLGIAQIALAAGFTDQSHLTRVFARRIGCTPARYRGARRPHPAG